MRHSFTSLDTFHKCPYQAKRVYIDRDVTRTSGPEAEEGTRIHKALELALLNDTPLPEPYAVWESYLASLRELDEVHCEGRLRLKADFSATDDDDEAFLVGEIDALAINGDRCVILDWKTGKPRDNKLQLQLYALLVLTHYPQVERGVACNVYLKYGQMGEALNFSRSELSALQNVVATRLFHWEAAERNNKWPKKPSGLCPWCPVKDCEFYREVV